MELILNLLGSYRAGPDGLVWEGKWRPFLKMALRFSVRASGQGV